MAVCSARPPGAERETCWGLGGRSWLLGWVRAMVDERGCWDDWDNCLRRSVVPGLQT